MLLPLNHPYGGHLFSPVGRANSVLRDLVLGQSNAELLGCNSMGSDIVSPVDSTRIDLRDFNEVSNWAEQFGVSRERIIRAIYTVGPDPRDVRREIMEAE